VHNMELLAAVTESAANAGATVPTTTKNEV
jgi:hypothetical protein